MQRVGTGRHAPAPRAKSRIASLWCELTGKFRGIAVFCDLWPDRSIGSMRESGAARGWHGSGRGGPSVFLPADAGALPRHQHGHAGCFICTAQGSGRNCWLSAGETRLYSCTPATDRATPVVMTRRCQLPLCRRCFAGRPGCCGRTPTFLDQRRIRPARPPCVAQARCLVTACHAGTPAAARRRPRRVRCLRSGQSPRCATRASR